MAEPIHTRAVAARYEQAFGHVSSHFVSLLLRKAALASGQQVLDIATGTALAAEAALAAVGPAGHVTAADLSPEMVEQARPSRRCAKRLFRRGGRAGAHVRGQQF
jgi:ubiquinone/menaquinone biosynthesis C-methylase UbiE